MATFRGMNRRVLPILFVAGILASLAPAAASQNRVSTGTIVYNYVGRIYIDPATGTGQVAGYFPSIANIGIDKAFQGAPSEATEFFTYRSEPLHFTNLPPDGDTAITLLDAGKWHIYFNPNPTGSWNEPSSFSQGQLIADLTHNALEIVSTGQAHQAVFSGELLAAYDFVFDGKELNLADFFLAGITNFSSATKTVVPGPPDFPVSFPDAGWAVSGAPSTAKETEVPASSVERFVETDPALAAWSNQMSVHRIGRVPHLVGHPDSKADV